MLLVAAVVHAVFVYNFVSSENAYTVTVPAVPPFVPLLSVISLHFAEHEQPLPLHVVPVFVPPLVLYPVAHVPVYTHWLLLPVLNVTVECDPLLAAVHALHVTVTSAVFALPVCVVPPLDAFP